MPKRASIYPLFVAGIVLSTLSACAVNVPGDDVVIAEPAEPAEPAETILLVSREDGTIVRQTIDLEADICMKMVTSATTTCFTSGPAIVNSAGMVVGYEMYEDTIELFASEANKTPVFH